MSDITLDGVRVRRHGRVVLDVPSLRLRAHHTTAVLGPNGAGKTTLLRFIAGLEPAAEGTVSGAASVSRTRDVAYAFQESVFLRQSVRQNLALGLRLRGVSASEIDARIEQAAGLLGVTHLLERRADHVSGGEGRRINLARALCLRAPLVLLDEPLSGLDERGYLELIDELPQILAAFKATTVFVTHSRDEAFRLAQEVVVLIGGAVRAAGDTQSVAATPRTPDVAQVLGYTVLDAAGRHVAVKSGDLKWGSGRLEFVMTVESVVHLLESSEVVGRIEGSRVHVRVGPGEALPALGARVLVSTDRFVEMN